MHIWKLKLTRHKYTKKAFARPPCEKTSHIFRNNDWEWNQQFQRINLSKWLSCFTELVSSLLKCEKLEQEVQQFIAQFDQRTDRSCLCPRIHLPIGQRPISCDKSRTEMNCGAKFSTVIAWHAKTQIFGILTNASFVEEDMGRVNRQFCARTYSVSTKRAFNFVFKS